MTHEIILKRMFTIVLCFLPSILQAGKTQTEYMAIMMGTQKIGHAVNSRSVEGSTVMTSEEFSITLGRGGQTVSVHFKETYIETTEGKPLSFEMVMKASGTEQKTSGTIQDGKIFMTRQVMGNIQDTILDWPTGALMPEGVLLQEKQNGLKPGTEYTLISFRPDMLMPVETSIVVGNKQQVDLLGRILELTEVKQISHIQDQQITMTSYLDDDFRTLKSLASMMGMTLEFIACDKDFAMQENDIIDFLEKLSVPSPIQLTNLKAVDSIIYEIKPTTDTKITLPASSHQTVQQNEGTLQVTVQKLTPTETIKFPYDGNDLQIQKALEPTEYLQCDNEEIVNLAKHAIGGTTDAAKAAKQIESFVAGYIQKKDLSVGYASAAEVAQTRQGDCSEHAVLTAAMCRAIGIPARIVCGVVYVDSFINQKSIFGGHMWVEVYLDGQWIGLDATRINQNGTGEEGFGPGHIALAYGDGSPTDFFNLVNTLGCFTIEKITVHKTKPKKEEQPQTL